MLVGSCPPRLVSHPGSSTGWTAGSSRTLIAPSWAGVTVSSTGPGRGAVTRAGVAAVSRDPQSTPETAAKTRAAPPRAQILTPLMVEAAGTGGGMYPVSGRPGPAEAAGGRRLRPAPPPRH